MFDPKIIFERSKENWDALELLFHKDDANFYNVAATRMYYSVFQLFFCEMELEHYAQIDASTQQHKLAILYVKERYGRDEQKTYESLKTLREQADYSKVPVTKDDFMKHYTVWREKYLRNSSNLRQRIST